MAENFSPFPKEPGIQESKPQSGAKQGLTRREFLFGRRRGGQPEEAEQGSAVTKRDSSESGEAVSHQKRKITRRQFLIGSAAAAGAAVAAGISAEARALSEKGATIYHLINVLCHIIRTPELFLAYGKVEAGVKRGEIIPDLRFLEQVVEKGDGYSLVRSRIPEWAPADPAKAKENFPVEAYSVSLSASGMRGGFSKEAGDGVAVPISEAIPVNKVVEPDKASGYGHGLGAVAVTPEGGVKIVVGDRGRLEQIAVSGGEFHQVPFAFHAGESLPAPVLKDTYLWCIVAGNDEHLLVHSTGVGVRVSVANQLRTVDKIFEEQGLGKPDYYLLTAKGSSSGIGVRGTSFGHPLALAREQSYLNIELSK